MTAPTAALQRLADLYAAVHGDTPRATADRRADLLADLDRQQARRGTPYRNARATGVLTATSPAHARPVNRT